MRLPAAPSADIPDASALYTRTGERKYLNAPEREGVFRVAATLDPEKRMLLVLLLYTGLRISEALSVTRHSIQRVEGGGVVSVATLKRRRHCVREIPIPPPLVAELDRTFEIFPVQGLRTSPSGAAMQPLWPWSRTTAYRLVVSVMHAAGIGGKRACPKGLRHGFGVASLHAGVPLTLLQKWMGHASLRTTAIYLSVCGPDEMQFASRLWETLAASEGIVSRETRNATQRSQ